MVQSQSPPSMSSANRVLTYAGTARRSRGGATVGRHAKKASVSSKRSSSINSRRSSAVSNIRAKLDSLSPSSQSQIHMIPSSQSRSDASGCSRSWKSSFNGNHTPLSDKAEFSSRPSPIRGFTVSGTTPLSGSKRRSGSPHSFQGSASMTSKMISPLQRYYAWRGFE